MPGHGRVSLPRPLPQPGLPGTLVQGQPYLIEVARTWSFAGNARADAECSRTATDLVTTSGSARCDPTGHSYQLRWTPQTTGPLVLAIEDERHTDNAGRLSVTVEPVG